MIINKISLENIRSYINEEVCFSEGSTLLSGDIGSGKSTILLAIDFALFGFTKGELSGDALLRNGEKKGNVELKFNIDGKEVIIKRGLKKVKDSVTQDYGYIYSDGIKREATANELKLIILNLLKYPKEMLTKKSLVYRYTVYTPQEEMKQILIGDKELRLDTLRKVFDIDKYKRIKENSKILLNKLKDKRKEFEILSNDLEIREKENIEYIKKIEEAEKNLNILNINLQEISNFIIKKKEEIIKEEKNITELNNLKKEFDVNKTDFRNKKANFENNKIRLGDLENSIKLLENSMKKEFSVDNILEKIKEKSKEILTYEGQYREVTNKLHEYKLNIGNSREIIKSIKDLDICPTCKQNVNEEYKNKVIESENEKIKNFEGFLMKCSEEYNIINESWDKLKKESENLRILEKEIELNKLRTESLNEKKELKVKLEKDNLEFDHEIKRLQDKELELLKILKEFNEESYNKKKEELETLLKKERGIEIEKAGLDNEIKNIKLILEKLNIEIKNKKRIRDKLNTSKEIQYFIEDKFTVLIDSIERRIMSRAHYDFSELFKKWFNILVDNELIQIDLDEEFTPKIQQNGYDIDYNYLSGGEKTAAALAYRLALNQVINNLMSEIKTRDLLILDEPTDGFSDEQLERMRFVLEELNIKQVIIVSHEDKIESFVDRVIRIEKKEHVSKVFK